MSNIFRHYIYTGMNEPSTKKEEVTWEEKNSIEQSKNYESLDELGNVDSIKITMNDLIKTDWQDITKTYNQCGH